MASRGIESRLQGKIFIVSKGAANATPADGNGFDSAGSEAVAFSIDILPGGTAGTINATFQHSNTTDVNASYAAIPDAQLKLPKTNAPPATSSGVMALAFNSFTGRRYLGYLGNFRFLRAITSGAAGTPDFGLAIGITATHWRHING